MAKHKHVIIILLGFLLLKETSTNPLKNENKCSPFFQGQYEQFPYIVIVKIKSKEEILCQGSLINLNWVLTSAQCMNKNDNISLNDINLTMGNKTQKTIRKPIKVILEKKNDVALIEMDKPIIIMDTVTPIELAAKDLSKDMKCVVNSFQKNLNENVSFIYWTNINISKQTYDKSEFYLEDKICHEHILWSLHNVTNKGIILVCDQYLYGINLLNKPRVFNNILNHKKWIQTTTNQANTIENSESKNKTFIQNNYLWFPLTSENAIGRKSNDSTSVQTENMKDTESDDLTSVYAKDTIRTKSYDASSVQTEETKKTESDDPTSVYTEDTKETKSYDASSVQTEDTKVTESDDPTSVYTEDTKETKSYDASSVQTEDTKVTESDDPTSVYTDESHAQSSATSPLTDYTREKITTTTESIKPTPFSVVTEDTKVTESDDPTSVYTEDTKETKSYDASSVQTEDTKVTESDDPTSVYTEDTKEIKSYDASSVQTEDTKVTESDDPTSVYTEDTKETKSYDASSVQTEQAKETESDDPTSVYTDKSHAQSSATSPLTDYTREKITSTTESIKSTPFSVVTGDTKLTESDDLTSVYTEHMIITESDDPMSVYTEDKQTYETEDVKHKNTETDKSKFPESSTQSLSTETSTQRPAPLTHFTIDDQTEETEDPITDTTVTQSSTAKTPISSVYPSTGITKEIDETDETEDDIFSDQPKSNTTVTPSPTMEISTSSSDRSTAMTGEMFETTETEDWKFTVTMYHDPTVYTTVTSQPSTSSITTTISTTTNQPSISTTTQLSSKSSTTATSETNKTNPTTMEVSDKPVYTTKSTEVTYDIHNSSETTTFVNEPFSGKSSSEIISININCITILCCIIFYFNL